MLKSIQRASLSLCTLAALALTACGGGGGGGSSSGSNSTTSNTSLTGTAAVGAAISGTVVAIDVNGKISPTATTSGVGAFTLDVSGMTAPFILSITGTAGGKQVVLTSVATAVGQTVNITPLTDLIVSAAAGRPAGATLADLCRPVAPATTAPADCLTALGQAADTTKLNTAVSDVMNMISTINPGNTNPLTGAFTANGTGMDKVLDQIAVSPATAQGDTATVTLIATNTQIGSAVLPGTPGTAATTASTPASNAQVSAADAANTALTEIKTCLNAFSALYAAPLSAPSQSRVTEFLDASFAHGSLTQASFSAAFSGNGANVIEGFTLSAVGFSPKDMTPFTAGEIGQIDTSNNNANFGSSQRTIFNNRTTTAFDSASGNTAWVRVLAKGDAGIWSMKMIKGSAYTGCAGGWKMAGSLSPAAPHMNARINRNANGSYTRSWPFHIEKTKAVAVGGANAFVTVRGAGLVVYSGNTNAPVGASTRVKLIQNANAAALVIAEGQTYYGTASDAIESCQDLATLASPPAAGTPCIDETQTSPGKIYLWTVMSDATTIANVFPFQTTAVPISKTFAQANASNIFATLGTATPASFASLQALGGNSLVGQITFTYTQGSAYNSRMEHCGIQVWNGATSILGAEQPPTGANRETTCTFTAPESIASNYGSNAFGFSGNATAAYIRLVTATLGNQAVWTQQLP